jgi:hypothetical protein
MPQPPSSLMSEYATHRWPVGFFLASLTLKDYHTTMTTILDPRILPIQAGGHDLQQAQRERDVPYTLGCVGLSDTQAACHYTELDK